MIIYLVLDRFRWVYNVGIVIFDLFLNELKQEYVPARIANAAPISITVRMCAG